VLRLTDQYHTILLHSLSAVAKSSKEQWLNWFSHLGLWVIYIQLAHPSQPFEIVISNNYPQNSNPQLTLFLVYLYFQDSTYADQQNYLIVFIASAFLFSKTKL
jgi:hypothetical protein